MNSSGSSADRLFSNDHTGISLVFHHLKHRILSTKLILIFFVCTHPVGHVVYAVNLQPLACWYWEFESHQRLIWLSLVIVGTFKYGFLLRFFTRPKESYRLCSVWMWSWWSLFMERPRPSKISCAMEKRSLIL